MLSVSQQLYPSTIYLSSHKAFAVFGTVKNSHLTNVLEIQPSFSQEYSLQDATVSILDAPRWSCIFFLFVHSVSYAQFQQSVFIAHFRSIGSENKHFLKGALKCILGNLIFQNLLSEMSERLQKLVYFECNFQCLKTELTKAQVQIQVISNQLSKPKSSINKMQF